MIMMLLIYQHYLFKTNEKVTYIHTFLLCFEIEVQLSRKIQIIIKNVRKQKSLASVCFVCFRAALLSCLFYFYYYHYYYYYYYYYYYDSTNVWMPRVKNKSFGWAANRNQSRHQLKFLVTITQ